MKYNDRYIARIVMQAETPLAVGSGNKELTIDRPVAKDANGLPYIPGTSLAGVLRHSIYWSHLSKGITEDELNDIFGYQDDDVQEESHGSRLALSSAHLVGKAGKVYDGLFLIPEEPDDVLDHFLNLPVRQHVKMTHRGAADTRNRAKFDEEVLYKGSRLIFELELKGNEDSRARDKEIWEEMFRIFRHPDFRIGSGTRKGFGEIKIVSINHCILCLDDPEQRKSYLDHSTCLDSEFKGDEFKPPYDEQSNHRIYTLNLEPEDFYLFSSGYKSDDADMNPVMEDVLTWDDPQNPTFMKEMVLVPASSVKGTISHRVAYHFNKLNGVYADNLPEGKTIEDFVGEKNTAVKALFGEASDYANEIPGHAGNVLPSDVFRKIDPAINLKKLDHVAIDRFTGGTIDGALFNENVVNDNITDNGEFELTFQVNPKFPIPLDHTEEANVIEAFESTLIDICMGSLPLGGGTMRGNGVFTGDLTKLENGKEELFYSNR